MRMEKFFDIRQGPPTAKQIVAKERALKRGKRGALVLAALALVMFFAGISASIVTGHMQTFLIVPTSFGFILAALLHFSYVYALSLLSKASNAILNKLLVLIESGVQLEEERPYIEQVLRQGRAFCWIELKILEKSMALRREGQQALEIKSELAAAVQAPQAGQ